MSFRDHETVETLSPIRRKQRLAVRLLAVLAGLAVVAAVGLTPALRRRLLGTHLRPTRVSIASTPPGADVFVDEEHVGATPTQAVLAPGKHTVRIVRDGYKPWRQTVDATATRAIAPTLEPLKLATLVVESIPEGAKVFLDGHYRDDTPATLKHVEAGTHTLRIEREPIHEPATQRVELKAGETRRIAVQLQSGLESLYQKRIQQEPAKLGNYTELIHLHVLNQRAEEAVEVIARALKILEGADTAPDELRRFYGELAQAYQGQAGAIDEATQKKLLDAIVVLFEKLVLARPDEPEYYRPLVMLLGKAKQWQAIVTVCSKTASVPEARGVVHVNVARMYLAWEEVDCAIMLLEPAIKLRPDYFFAHYYLGSAYRQADRHDDALREYLVAEKLSANSSFYYRGLVQTGIARLLAAKGDVDGAIARYKKALELKVSPYYSCQWRLLFAQFLAEHGRRQEALEQYRQILRITPDSKYGRAARKALRRLGSQ